MKVLKAEDLQRIEDIEKSSDSRIENSSIIPPGYIPIHLTSNGMLGAPAIVNVRNFKTVDLVNLSVETQDSLPEAVVTLLNSIIFEDVNVGEWTEKEIIELLLKVFANYYSTNLPDIPFPWNDDDVKWLNEHGRKSEAKRLTDGTWTPRVDINLATNVEFFDLEPGTKTIIRIGKKDYKVSLTIPRFGDVIVIKKFLKEKFSNEEAKYSIYRKRYQRDNDSLTGEEETLLMSYEKERLFYTTELIRALNIYRVTDGDKVYTPESITEKLKLAEDARMDVKIFQKADEEFLKIKYGVNPQITVTSPITQSKVTRGFSFRLLDILSALRVYNPDEYAVDYDD